MLIEKLFPGQGLGLARDERTGHTYDKQDKNFVEVAQVLKGLLISNHRGSEGVKEDVGNERRYPLNSDSHG